MNRPLRVLLIGRYFWPHSSIDSGAYLSQLAIGLKRSGLDIHVMCPRFDSGWPDELVVQEVPVHRPAIAPRTDWAMGRYIRQVTNWLREHRNDYDVLLVNSLREESAAAIEAVRGSDCRVAVRYWGWGRSGDGEWWTQSRAARRCAMFAKSADLVISPSAASQRILLGEGFSHQQLARVDDGFLSGSERKANVRQTARRDLAAMNGDLRTDDHSTVVLCCGRMTESSGMNVLARACPPLIAARPDTRVWFVGDGPGRDSIYEGLRSDGIRASIAMPGSFSDIEQVIQAADIYVQMDEQGIDPFLRIAISAQLPVVTMDCESTRAVIMGPQPAEPNAIHAASLLRWVPRDSSSALQQQLIEMIDHKSTVEEQAAALHRLVLRRSPQHQTIEKYIALLNQLVVNRRDHDNSIEAVS